jgi:hypothetical protein
MLKCPIHELPCNIVINNFLEAIQSNTETSDFQELSAKYGLDSQIIVD